MIFWIDLLFSQGRWSQSDHSDLGRTKNLLIYGQFFVFSELWSDQ